MNNFFLSLGAFHLVRTQYYMLSVPPPPLFACNTQWKCMGRLDLPHPLPLGAYVLNGRSLRGNIKSIFFCLRSPLLLLLYHVTLCLIHRPGCGLHVSS